MQNNTAFYDDFMESIVMFDSLNNIIYANNETVKMFACNNKDEMLGRSIYSLALESEKHIIDEALKHDRYINHKIYLVRRNGTIFIARTQAKNSVINNVKSRIVTIIDISVKHCTLNTLTSLKTRERLDVKFNNLMQNLQQSNESTGAIFVDINNFKQVNDLLYHRFRDDVIKNISDILVSDSRNSDVVVRWGGEEFLILLFDISLSQLQKIAERLRAKINNMIINEHYTFSYSFGIDMIKKDDTLSKVIHRIDKALTNTKSGSGNKVIQYS